MNCDIYKIVELKKRSNLTILWDLLFKRKPTIELPKLGLHQYKCMILIAPIWNAKIASPMLSFIDFAKSYIKEYSFITICSGRKGQKEKITRQLTHLIGRKPKTFTELHVNDLLPLDKKNKIRYTTPYRITKRDLQNFSPTITNFANSF